MARKQRQLRSQELRTHNHQGDALRLGMNWTEDDLSKPQVLVESAWGMGHPGTFHFEPLITALTSIAREEMGREALRAGLRSVVIENTSGKYYPDEWAKFEAGVLTRFLRQGRGARRARRDGGHAPRERRAPIARDGQQGRTRGRGSVQGRCGGRK